MMHFCISMRLKLILITVGVMICSAIIWVFATQTWYSSNTTNQPIAFQTPISNHDLDRLVEESVGIKTWPNISTIAQWQGLKLNVTGGTSLVVQPKTSFWNLIRLLVRFQNEQQVIVIRSHWDLDALDAKMCEKFKWEKGSLKSFLQNEKNYLHWNELTFCQDQLHPLNWQVLFVPNSYLFKRKTTINKFMEKMSVSAHDFWTKERMLAATRIGLTPADIVNLASIVTKESNHVPEYGKIAATYKNRLKKGMLLQADPTVVFARGKAGRVLNRDTKIESPYNTYLNTGLPIGPLCIPSIAAIDSCLFGATYPYIYFCAKSDLTPKHDFAITLDEHNKNAQRFHRALNQYLKGNR